MPTFSPLAALRKKFSDAGQLLGLVEQDGDPSPVVVQDPSTGSLYANGSLVSGGRPYIGQFSSGARMPTAFIAAATATQANARARYIVRNTVFGAQFSFPNFMLVSNNGGLETGTGASSTFAAGLEYGGSTYQHTWAGATSVVVPDLSWSPWTDPLPFNLYEGDAYFHRTFYSNPNGIMIESGLSGAECGDSANGEGFRYALSGLTDQSTGTGALTAGTAANQHRFGPMMHVANITKPSIYIGTSSLNLGYRDTALGGLGFGDKGIIARSLGPYFGYANFSQGGASVGNFLTAGRSTLRQQMMRYFSHIVIDGGVNDILNDNVDANTIAARLAAFATLFPDQQCWNTTVMPRTTGAWTLADGSDQTVYTTNNWHTRRPALNTLIRSGINGFQGYFDVSAAVELPTDSAKWYADGTPYYMFQPYTTPDGLHPGRNGGERVRLQGVINPARITR